MYPLKNQQHKPMLKVFSILIATCAVAWGCSSTNNSSDSDPPSPANSGVMGDGQFEKVLESIVSDFGIPAATAMFVHKDQILEQGAAGQRRIDQSDKVTVDDQWHIGSITKSMTSTLAALLVEQGVIEWDTTIADVFPELTDNILDSYHAVELDELLSHTGSISTRSSIFLDRVDQTNPDVHTQRLQFTQLILSETPKHDRGTYAYSNGGYVIAGTMLEKLSGKDWETLMRDELFSVLGMDSSGFGAPGADGSRGQPLGHFTEDGQWNPIPADSPEADNPALFGPAGTVHTTMADIYRYIELHLQAAKGANSGSLLSDENFYKLHTPQSSALYSLGWNAVNQTLSHIGSNDRSLSQVILVPELDIALFIAINAADPFNAEGGAPLAALNKIGQTLQTRFNALNAESR